MNKPIILTNAEIKIVTGCLYDQAAKLGKTIETLEHRYRAYYSERMKIDTALNSLNEKCKALRKVLYKIEDSQIDAKENDI